MLTEVTPVSDAPSILDEIVFLPGNKGVYINRIAPGLYEIFADDQLFYIHTRNGETVIQTEREFCKI